MSQKLKKLPSVIRENKFNKEGLVETEFRILVPAYIGSQLGFNTLGKNYLEKTFYPELKRRGVLPLCPFAACDEYLDFSKLNDEMSAKEFKLFWSRFNDLIGIVNYETLMPRSKFMIALFDGSHASDDGLCAEVGYFAPRHGHIIGIRSDFRLCENISALINPAIRYFIDKGPYKGQFFSGPNAYETAFDGIEKLARDIRCGKQ